MLDLVAGGILVVNVVLLVVNGVLNWSVQRMLRKNGTMVDELSRCNGEFAEATALFQYGALDEAIEVAQRATKRRQQEKAK